MGNLDRGQDSKIRQGPRSARRSGAARRREAPAPPETPLRAFVHDLASPIAAIRFSAGTLRARRKLTARALADVERIEQAAEVLARTLAELAAPGSEPALFPRRPAPNEPVDLYVLCCELAEVRQRRDGRAVHCRAFGDSRGAWDRAELVAFLTRVLDHVSGHLDARAPLTVSVTGLARHVRIDLHGVRWLSPKARAGHLRALAAAGRSPAGALVTITSSRTPGTIFTVRLPRVADGAPARR
ncbi:MAG TPA: hypothetical protein VHO06_22220 [Polyangia bacterium]|nr:hypothetical protein [Polyangia bacterium]